MNDEPLDPHQCRELLRRILAKRGAYRFSRHAEERLEERDMTHVDVVNLARGGHVDCTKTEFKNGTWRYVIYTPAMCVVVAFDDDYTVVKFVTAWRN